MLLFGENNKDEGARSVHDDSVPDLQAVKSEHGLDHQVGNVDDEEEGGEPEEPLETKHVLRGPSEDSELFAALVSFFVQRVGQLRVGSHFSAQPGSKCFEATTKKTDR